MIRAWISKLWHRDGLPKAVDVPPMPLYNHDPSKAIGRVLSVEDAKGGIEVTYNLKYSALSEFPETAKMRQIKEYKRSALYE